MRAQALAAACVLVGGFSPAVRADDPAPPRAVTLPSRVAPAAEVPDNRPLDRTELDRRIATIAHGTALFGSRLWETQNYEGCFRLYQGTIAALLPVLDHRPQLAGLVQDRLDKAIAASADPVKAAFLLREALDAIQKDTEQALAPKKTLWERLGGEKVVRAIIHDFLETAAADPKVNLTRGGKYKLDAKQTAHLEQLMVEYISKETGGPLKYTGRDMKTAHTGMKITDDEFRALQPHLVGALQRNKIPIELMVELGEKIGKTRAQIIGQ